MSENLKPTTTNQKKKNLNGDDVEGGGDFLDDTVELYLE